MPLEKRLKEIFPTSEPDLRKKRLSQRLGCEPARHPPQVAMETSFGALHTLFDPRIDFSRRHRGTEIDGNEIGTAIVDGPIHLHQDLRHQTARNRL